MRRTVFYSWQSDLPNATNHAFIGGCLNEAVDSLSKGNDVADGLGLDRDTLNRQGSPEIAATIIEKIESCDAFVADVSIINPDVQLGERKTPNPNVLIELGYAAHARGGTASSAYATQRLGGLRSFHLTFAIEEYFHIHCQRTYPEPLKCARN